MLLEKTVLFSWTPGKDVEDPQVPQIPCAEHGPPRRCPCGSYPPVVGINAVPRLVTLCCESSQDLGQGLHSLTVGAWAKLFSGPQCPVCKTRGLDHFQMVPLSPRVPGESCYRLPRREHCGQSGSVYQVMYLPLQLLVFPEHRTRHEGGSRGQKRRRSL